MYILVFIDEIVENQDLCRNKDNFNIYYFNLKDFIFFKFICKMYIFAVF